MNEKSENTSVLFVWKRMKAGDEQSLSWLFAFFYSDLYHYGIKIQNSPDLVQDSIQDIFSRIWEKRETLGDIQNPKAYLIASLRRRLLRNIHSLKSIPVSELSNETPESEFSLDSSDFIEKKELSVQLRNALVNAITNLPPRHRELIYLRFYHRLRYAQIAEIMNVNEQTVRNLMQRTLSRLRSQIDQNLMEGLDYLDGLVIALLQIFRTKS
ncbi:MAG TPA: RNA polymerase sigma factor [Prolixibacteraceae bacterium]|mgnify:CR=1 FL=1|nr:RNA polymerase sigma factor [Prolixibacteraceae bacterium]HPR85393.1 RNA polymerase sigma factor [Prolixibacteraceae bacterium]